MDWVDVYMFIGLVTGVMAAAPRWKRNEISELHAVMLAVGCAFVWPIIAYACFMESGEAKPKE